MYRAIMLTIRSPTSLISYQAMLRLNLFVEDRLARLVYMKDWCGLIEQDLVPKRVLKHKVDFFIFPRLQSGKRQGSSKRRVGEELRRASKASILI